MIRNTISPVVPTLNDLYLESDVITTFYHLDSEA